MIQDFEIRIGQSLLRGALNVPDDFKSLSDELPALNIMVHHYPGNRHGHSQFFDLLENELANDGKHCLRFDFRGCGQSQGEAQNFSIRRARSDLLAVIDWAYKHGYTRIILIGEGLGATVAMLSHSDEDDQDISTSGYILLWPLLDLPFSADQIYKSDDGIESPLYDDLMHIDLPNTLKTIREPMQVMHGTHDEISPIDRLDFLRAYSASKRLDITSFQGGVHGLIKDSERSAIAFHIKGFIDKYGA